MEEEFSYEEEIIIELKAENARLKDRVKELEQQVGSVECDNNNLLHRLAELEETVSRDEDIIYDFKSKIKKLNERHTGIKAL